MSFDPWKVLGIEETEDKKEIEKAFDEKLAECDLEKDAEKISKINAAYDLVTNLSYQMSKAKMVVSKSNKDPEPSSLKEKIIFSGCLVLFIVVCFSIFFLGYGGWKLFVESPAESFEIYVADSAFKNFLVPEVLLGNAKKQPQKLS